MLAAYIGSEERDLSAAARRMEHPRGAVSTLFFLPSGQVVLFWAHLAGQQLAVGAVRAHPCCR